MKIVNEEALYGYSYIGVRETVIQLGNWLLEMDVAEQYCIFLDHNE